MAVLSFDHYVAFMAFDFGRRGKRDESEIIDSCATMLDGTKNTLILLR